MADLNWIDLLESSTHYFISIIISLTQKAKKTFNLSVMYVLIKLDQVLSAQYILFYSEREKINNGQLRERERRTNIPSNFIQVINGHKQPLCYKKNKEPLRKGSSRLHINIK